LIDPTTEKLSPQTVRDVSEILDEVIMHEWPDIENTPSTRAPFTTLNPPATFAILNALISDPK
jgi:hypothetical protein